MRSLSSPCRSSRWVRAFSWVLAACALTHQHVATAQSVDTTFTPPLPEYVSAVGILPDGKIITGSGYRTNSTGTALYRVNPNGTLDTSFSYIADALPSRNDGFITNVVSASCFMDGGFVLSGAFRTINSILRVPLVVRFSPSGSPISYPAPEVYNTGGVSGWVVYPFVNIQPDNTAFFNGDFAQAVPGGLVAGIMKVSSSGAIVSSFRPKPQSSGLGSTPAVDHKVNSVVVQPDGKVLLAGEFIKVNGLSYPYLARVTAAGALDTAFNPAPNGICYVVAVQRDGKILVAGQFSFIAGSAALGIARLNTDGSIDNSFSATVNGPVLSMAQRADGSVLIGGGFNLVNGVSRNNLALLNSDGSTSSSYASVGTNNFIEGLALQTDGQAVLAGGFSFIGSTARSYMGRITADVPAVNTLTMDAEGSLIDWTRGGSAPEVENAEFRMATNGVNFNTVLGKGTRTPTGWRLSNIALPGNQNFSIQVRGMARSGFFNGSSSIIQSRANFFRPKPSITDQPTSQTVVVGDTGVTFSVTATSAAALYYQWKRNGASIPGAIQSSYAIPGEVNSSHAGTYTCTVSSSAGAVTSNPAVLTVVTPITIVKPPTFQAVLLGGKATFTVTATGTSPTYRWKKNGTHLPSFTGPTMVISPVTLTDETTYTVEVSNFAGAVESAPVNLFIVDTPADITAMPGDQILPLGATSVPLAATVSSESPPVCQWFKNNKPIAKATSPTLTLGPVKLADAGRYTLRASNPVGGITSATSFEVAVVDVLSTKEWVIPATKSVTLKATASGSGLTYKWRKGNGMSATYPALPGANTPILTLTNLSTADTDTYTCEVTGPGGTLDAAPQQVTVTTGAPVVAPTFDLPPGMVGAEYNYTIPMDPSSELRAATFVANNLPPGLVLNSVTGQITGRPKVVRTYTVTITPSNGSGFGTPVTDTLEIQAVPQELVGSFIALAPAEPASQVLRLGARLDLTVTSKLTYSGKLYLGSTTHSFTGGWLNANVGQNLTNTFTIPRKGQSPVTLTFDLDTVDLLLTGSLTHGSHTVTLGGWKKKWSATEKPTSFKGYYTVALTPPPPAPGDLSYPPGDSYVTFTVTDTGSPSVAGRTADGNAFTTSGGFVGPTGQLAVYNGLYGATGGVIRGELNINPAGAAPDYPNSSVTGTLAWEKRPAYSSFAYPNGFAPLTLTSTGAKYTHIIPGANVMGTNVLTKDVQVTFTGARVETGPQLPGVNAQLTDKNVFVFDTLASGLNPAATTLKLIPSSGLFTGSFTQFEDVDPGTKVKIVRRTAKISGVIVRNPAAATGEGFGSFTLVQRPGNSVSEVLSGSVRLTDLP